MIDSPKAQVGIYSTRTGGRVLLTARQETALQRAGALQALGYRFVDYDYRRPTHTDMEILAMCNGYRFISHIGLLHGDYRSPDAPYLVSNPERFEPSAACGSFADAVKCAVELFRCDIVTIRGRDFRREFESTTDHWRVTLLIV